MLPTKLKYAPYSYSKVSLHDQCNRKFKYRYIDKLPTKPKDLTPLLKGGAVHSILEHYPNPSKHKLAKKYQYIADNFIKTSLGEKYLKFESINEYSFGLDRDLNCTTYKDKNALFRGYVDYIVVIDDILYIIDWKTGKFVDLRWMSFDQLMSYAIYFFKRYPTIDKIKISYVYVEHENAENDLLLERKYLDNYINHLMKLINDTEIDIEFKKSPSKLCDWCDYKEHCDKN